MSTGRLWVWVAALVCAALLLAATSEAAAARWAPRPSAACDKSHPCYYCDIIQDMPICLCNCN